MSNGQVPELRRLAVSENPKPGSGGREKDWHWKAVPGHLGVERYAEKEERQSSYAGASEAASELRREHDPWSGAG
jgi:hypothetical protein